METIAPYAKYKKHRQVDTSAFSLRALAIKLGVKPATLRYKIIFDTLTSEERLRIMEALCEASNKFIQSEHKIIIAK